MGPASGGEIEDAWGGWVSVAERRGQKDHNNLAQGIALGGRGHEWNPRPESPKDHINLAQGIVLGG